MGNKKDRTIDRYRDANVRLRMIEALMFDLVDDAYAICTVKTGDMSELLIRKLGVIGVRFGMQMEKDFPEECMCGFFDGSPMIRGADNEERIERILNKAIKDAYWDCSYRPMDTQLKEGYDD